MRAVEYQVEGDDLTSLREALKDRSGSESVLWDRDVDLGEGLGVSLQVRGGKEDPSWVDVVLTREGGLLFEDPRSLDVGDGPLADLVLNEVGVVLTVTEGRTLVPSR